MPPEGKADAEGNEGCPEELDVLIVGAGFSGIEMLHRLRPHNLKVHIFEAGAAVGGTWHCNVYPGARVDSHAPLYELAIPEVWRSWTWSERFPSGEELQAYFRHCDRVLGVSKHTSFHTRVTNCRFDEVAARWTVQTSDGKCVRARFVVAGVGFAAKQYVPEWPGLSEFRGQIHHTSHWPRAGVEVAGKRVAVVGTGSTGVQVVQEFGKRAAHLTVFQRTPNMCIHMGQRPLTPEEQEKDKVNYPRYYEERLKTRGGLLLQPQSRRAFEDTPEEREAFLEKTWAIGDFSFWSGNYENLLTDEKVNRLVYDFWAKKVRARIQDPRKRDILAPLEPPHPFGTKRPSLEMDYYEQFNKANVEVVDVSANPIVSVVPEGLVTADGRVHEVEVIALATGFDAVTGSLVQMGVHTLEGRSLEELWRDGVQTFMGVTVPGCPNFFFTYGPQAPTAFANGPTCIEIQTAWIERVIVRLQREHVKYLDAQPAAAALWNRSVHDIAAMTLFPKTKSWYMGANIPGKKVEMLNFCGGLDVYAKILEDCWERDLEGFKLVN